MIRFDDIPEIYIACQPVDLRKGIDGYASIIQEEFVLDPGKDALYIFTNRSHNKLKCLYYDGTGFWLLYKRLNKGTFKWNFADQDVLEITRQQLGWLLDGLSVYQKRAFKAELGKYA